LQFEIVILGCGAAVPTLRHAPTAQAVNWHGRWFLIDAGEGVQLGLRKNSIPFQKIEAIFISHMHGDHVLGLPGLIGSMSLLGRKKNLTIIGPAELQAFLMNALKSTSTHLDFELEFKTPSDIEKMETVHTWDECAVTSFPVKHRISAFGYIFQFEPIARNIRRESILTENLSRSEILALKGGLQIQRDNGKVLSPNEHCLPLKPSKKYVYSGDTSPCEGLREAALGADVLYHEATFLHELAKTAKATGHSTARQAGILAHEAGVKTLIIGHFSSRYKEEAVLLDEAKQQHTQTIAANENLRITL
jgi:ribonuclease Z